MAGVLSPQAPQAPQPVVVRLLDDLGVRPSAQSSLMKARKRGSLDADFGSVSHQAI